jgi:hypothetical protein
MQISYESSMLIAEDFIRLLVRRPREDRTYFCIYYVLRKSEHYVAALFTAQKNTHTNEKLLQK